MKTIAYVINTEYHLLVTASLIHENVDNETEAEHLIIEVGDIGSPRLRAIKDRSALGVAYERWSVDAEENSMGGTIKQKVEALIHRDIDTLVVFLDDYPLCVYLIKALKRRGVRIVLAPDGIKPYYDLTFGGAARFRSGVKKTWKLYQTLLGKGLIPSFAHFNAKQYGTLSEIDEIWLDKPHLARNPAEKPVRKISILQHQRTRDALARVFKFDIEEDLPSRNRVIFYTNNLLFREAAYAEERSVIKHMMGIDSNELYVKLHPQTPASHRDKIIQLGVKVLDRSVPAELYIAELDQSIVISGWSASLMQFNPRCTFYWLVEYFRARGCMYKPIAISNPCAHITEPRCLTEIVFPTGKKSTENPQPD